MIIAMEYFYECPERMHTDSHRNCIALAELLGRSEGALDRILRNIKFVDGGGAGLANASQLIHDLVGEFMDNRAGLQTAARIIRRARGWPPLDCND